VVLVDEFQRAGVEVIFLNRVLGQRVEADLRLQVQGMMAEDERAKIVERHRWGKRHAARAGAVYGLLAHPERLAAEYRRRVHSHEPTRHAVVARQ
jgi:site-specific DNA recombinase